MPLIREGENGGVKVTIAPGEAPGEGNTAKICA